MHLIAQQTLKLSLGPSNKVPEIKSSGSELHLIAPLQNMINVQISLQTVTGPGLAEKMLQEILGMPPVIIQDRQG